jgi:uncharacterized protein (DUF169 family)
MDTKTQGKKLLNLLGLSTLPVAIAFRSTAPDNVQRVNASGPSSCSYWKLAGDGEVFYTETADHLNCTIGAYTHGVELPQEKAKELKSMVGDMVKLEYIHMEEVPDIPHREGAFGVVVYAPLAEAPLDPDVVIVRGNAKQIMLLSEAAKAANIEHEAGTMGRPTCAFIPAALQSDKGMSSLGCIGNRVYTGLGDDELYFVIPGSKVNDVVDKLETICNANSVLEKFHRERAAAVVDN